MSIYITDARFSVWNLKDNKAGNVMCSLHSTDKNPDGTKTYMNWNATFNRKLTEAAHNLKERDYISVTGFVTQYKTQREGEERPTYNTIIRVNEFNIITNSSNAQHNQPDQPPMGVPKPPKNSSDSFLSSLDAVEDPFS